MQFGLRLAHLGAVPVQVGLHLLVLHAQEQLGLAQTSGREWPGQAVGLDAQIALGALGRQAQVQVISHVPLRMAFERDLVKDVGAQPGLCPGHGQVCPAYSPVGLLGLARAGRCPATRFEFQTGAAWAWALQPPGRRIPTQGLLVEPGLPGECGMQSQTPGRSRRALCVGCAEGQLFDAALPAGAVDIGAAATPGGLQLGAVWPLTQACLQLGLHRQGRALHLQLARGQEPRRWLGA